MMNLTQIERDVLTEIYNQMDEGDTKVRMDDVVSAASTEVEEGEELEEGEYSSSRVYGTLSTLQRKDMLHVTREADPEDPKGKKVKYIVPKGQYAAMVGEVEPQDIAAQQAEETEITAPTRGLEARTSTRETRMKRLDTGLKLRVRARPLILRQRIPSSLGVASSGKLRASNCSHLPASIRHFARVSLKKTLGSVDFRLGSSLSYWSSSTRRQVSGSL